MLTENSVALQHLINTARQTMMGAKPLRQPIEDPTTNNHQIGNTIVHHEQPITCGKDVDAAVDHYRNELNNHEPGSPNHTEISRNILPDLLRQRVQFDKRIHPRQLYNRRY